MKFKITILSIILILLVGTACERLDRFTQFELEYSESVVIPSTLGINLPFAIYTPNIKSNSESTLSINDTRKDLVESVHVRSLKAMIQAPAWEDFSFLESITVYLSADGLNETMVAWKKDISKNTGNELILDVSDSNLQEYVLKDSFDLRVETITDEILSNDYQIKIDAVFFVDAKILGL